MRICTFIGRTLCEKKRAPGPRSYGINERGDDNVLGRGSKKKIHTLSRRRNLRGVFGFRAEQIPCEQHIRDVLCFAGRSFFVLTEDWS